MEEKDNKKTPNTKRKHSIYSIILCWSILIIFVVALIYFGKSMYTSIKYKEYTLKMEQYGLDKLYDNQKANANQKVSMSEMIKVVIGSIKNIENIYDVDENNTYNNEVWVKYAKSFGIIDENYINVSNQDSNAKYVDTGAIISKSMEKLIGKKLYKTGDSNYTNLADYGELENYVVRAGENGIFDKQTGRLSNCNLNKGMLNKMIITVVEEYGLLVPSNKDKKTKIVTDKNDMPSNYEDYPYIIDTIEKEIYEKEFKVYDSLKIQTPKEVYSVRKTIYNQVYEMVKNYFNVILNVDYNKVTTDELYDSLSEFFYYDYDKSVIEEYVNYVKKNKIKIYGKAEPLLPIMYNDGGQFRMRVKVDFTILNTKTNKNVLFPDVLNNDNIEYKDANYSMYVDLGLGELFENISLKIMMNPLLSDTIDDIDTIVRVNE